MTALEALEKTKKMWKWLALHPEAMKIEYFMKNGIISPEHHNCFLCDYAFENYTRDIFQCTAKCPLFKLWSKKEASCIVAKSPTRLTYFGKLLFLIINHVLNMRIKL